MLFVFPSDLLTGSAGDGGALSTKDEVFGLILQKNPKAPNIHNTFFLTHLPAPDVRLNHQGRALYLLVSLLLLWDKVKVLAVVVAHGQQQGGYWLLSAE